MFLSRQLAGSYNKVWQRLKYNRFLPVVEIYCFADFQMEVLIFAR